MYFKIEQDENKNYEVRMTEKFYEYACPFYKKDSGRRRKKNTKYNADSSYSCNRLKKFHYVSP